MKPQLKKRFEDLPGPCINHAMWPNCDLPFGTDERYGAVWISEEERMERWNQGEDDLADYPNGWFVNFGSWPQHWKDAFYNAKQEIYRQSAAKEISAERYESDLKALLNRYRCGWS